AVVVDVLGVLHLGAGGLLEIGDGLLVDVERPVRDPERLAGEVAGRRRRRIGVRRGGAFLGAAAARGQQAVPQHQTARAQRRPSNEAASGDRLAEKRVQLLSALVGLSSAHWKTPA